MDFLTTLEQLGISTWVRESGSIWAYPTVLWLHTIGMGTVAGLIAVINLRLLGFPSGMPVKPLERLYSFAWWGFALNAVTGTLLLLADATTKLRNPTFYIKMVFILIGLMIFVSIRKKVFGDPDLDKGPLPGNTKAMAWASMVCWLGAITSGRLMAYVGPVSGLAGGAH